MAIEDNDETRAALLTAGLVAIGAAVLVGTMPGGLVFGVIAGAAGAVLAFAMIAIVWRDWRRRTPAERQARTVDPDRFWNAEVRLKSLVTVSAVFTILPAVISVVNPSDDRWATVFVSAPLLVVAAVSYLFVRRRNLRRQRENQNFDA